MIAVFVRPFKGSDANVLALFDQSTIAFDFDIKASISEGLLLKGAVGIGGDEVIFAVVFVGEVGNSDLGVGGAENHLVLACGLGTGAKGCGAGEGSCCTTAKGKAAISGGFGLIAKGGGGGIGGG